ncbi:MAG: ribosome maturation factor RimM [Clostridiales bacterium]|nr:ribosome maturation factor RimM [Clostridiales bacterium]
MDMFRIGVYSNTHGIKGEIKVFPTTDDLGRFDYLKEVLLETKRDGLVRYEVSGCRYFKNMVIMKFKGIDNINDIEKYKGCDIYVTRENAARLEEGEYYIADIIGAEVISDEGELIGKLTDVLQTGANDVYVVLMPDGKEVLFPVIKECVLDIDTDNKRVLVHVMKGLLND